jgi:hypothetical protein
MFRPDMRLLRHPSISRAPELNWLTTAEPPKFSRQSLKAEGVIMPVSVKEMRRRSTSGVSMTGSVRSVSSTRTTPGRIIDRYALGATPESMQSIRDLASPPASPALSEHSIPEDDTDADMDPISPPMPPFFSSSKNTSRSSMLSSSSSVGTASVEESDIPETPSLSRTSSVTDHDDEEGGMPRTPPGTIASAGSVGVVSMDTKDPYIRDITADKAGKDGIATSDEVKVDVVAVRNTTAKGSIRDERENGTRSEESKVGQVQRKGTLKKVFGSVFGRRSGSISLVKS